jgi:N-acetylneuraminic acid mutarotase
MEVVMRSNLFFPLILSLILNIVIIAQTGNFLLTSPMSESRQFENSPIVLLPNGQVFISGGVPGTGNSGAGNARISTEIFNPLTETWSYAAQLNIRRVEHQATLLDDGTVLITGGHASSFSGGTIYNSAEIYDPSTNTMILLSNQMVEARTRHSAVKLQDGRVLILGGHSHATQYSSAEIYDPYNETFTLVGGMSTVRGGGQSAVLLNSGKVLVVGGTSVLTAEIFDPIMNTFNNTGNLNSVRTDPTATLLTDGNVLIVGGGGGGVIKNTAEVYNPASNTFTLLSSTMNTPRHRHEATLLDNGRVLICGGEPSTPTELNTAEIFDPFTESFNEVNSLNNARFDFASQKLNDGRILITGGADDTGSGSIAISGAEIFNPSLSYLVAYYPFNGNANDESGYGNHGIVYGAYLTEDMCGNSNSAYYFDGIDDKIVIGDITYLDNNSEATISFWVEYSNPGNNDYNPMVSKGPIAQWEGSFNVWHSNGADKIHAGFIQGWDYGSGASSDISYMDNQWHHVLVTLKDKIVKIFIDGVLGGCPRIESRKG